MRLSTVSVLLLLSGCVAPRSAPPPVAQRPLPVPPVEAPLVQPGEDWRDVPLTPGGWTLLPGAAAGFGPAGAAATGAQPLFALRCDPARRTVALVRSGSAAPGATMVITTSAGVGRWPASATAAGASVVLSARDPFLDKIAFSRGRVLVEVTGLPRLVVPAWAEPARVIEQCRL